MKRIYLIVSFTLIAAASWGQFNLPRNTSAFVTKNQVGAAALTEHIAPIIAPFDMPQLQKQKFADYSLNITST